MDTGVDTSVTIQELSNVPDVGTRSLHTSRSVGVDQSPANASDDEWHPSTDRTQSIAAVTDAVPQPNTVSVSIIEDQMDWRPTPESTQDDNQSRSPPVHSSDHDRADGERSNSPPPPDRQDGPMETVRSEAHTSWAEFEDDLSTPSDAELREIESARDGDYSAYQHDYWEQSFYHDIDDPEYRPTEKARITWRFKGVRGTRDKPNRAEIMRSPAAYVGGYWWTIKFFPRGNDVSSLSIYLECSRSRPATEKALCQGEFRVVRGPPNADLGDSDTDVDLKLSGADDPAAWIEDYYKGHPSVAEDASSHESWRVPAQIGVVLYNPEEPRVGRAHSSCHQFNPHNVDWGWTNFHGPWDSIHRRQRGQRRALLQHDTLAFDAYIRIFDDPTQSLWWHPSDSEPTWDSLSLTGYRALGSSKSTNTPDIAGLASWIHLAPFCRIIQGVDTYEHLVNCNSKPRPLCVALHKLLYELRARDEPLEYADTDGITAVLHNLREYSSDVSEFWERLRRALELELAGTEAAEQFAKLFDSPSTDELGDDRMLGPIHTLPKDLNSRIYAPAESVKSTREALEQYLSTRPGRWLLPAVLHVEFGRQKLDLLAQRWRLIYNRVELDEELDLTPWVLQGQCGHYVLYGYIVHREQRTSGKFFSILRPGGPGTKWLAFDDGRHDSRIECLTHKAALRSRTGLDMSQPGDDKRGHDVAVVAMYVRSNAVGDFLPGPQGQWDPSAFIKKYDENGTHLKATDETSPKQPLQVEVYSLRKYDELGGLFDTYDLMSYAKIANSTMYLNLPRSTSMAEVRKRIAQVASTNNQRIHPEHVRLWRIGRAGAQFAATLAFCRVSDLDINLLEEHWSIVRLWMEVVSGEDAKYFAMSDPQEANMSESKWDDGAAEHGGSDPSREQADQDDREQIRMPEGQGGHNDHVLSISSEQSPPGDPRSSSMGDASHVIGSSPPARPHESFSAADSTATNTAVDDAAIATIIANDVEAMDAEGQHTGDEATQGPDASQEAAVFEASVSRGPNVRLPVRHVYYFIQVFNAESQVLLTVGSFFSRSEENIKAALRKQLHWTEDKNFSIWMQTDRPMVPALTCGEKFEEICIPDGACLIVGDKLSKQRSTELEVSGKFTRPDLFIDYLWARARDHPIHAFTGFKTVEATFTGDYYCGEFKNGHYHGRGKHISSSACTYEGDFVFGRRYGKGVMLYPSGDRYDGEWVDDKRHGHGVFVEHKTGNKYVGGYKDGKRHGKGVSYWEVADEEMDLCQICYGEEQDALFYDCGHVCACVTCAKQVDTCPICRKKVIGVVRIYRT